MALSSLSSYLYRQQPGKYGGQQEDYLVRAEAAIEEAVLAIQSSASRGEKLTDLFFSLQKQICSRRHEIAMSHSTKNAELFGAPRFSRESHPCEYGYITPMTRLDDCCELLPRLKAKASRDCSQAIQSEGQNILCCIEIPCRFISTLNAIMSPFGELFLFPTSTLITIL